MALPCIFKWISGFLRVVGSLIFNEGLQPLEGGYEQAGGRAPGGGTAEGPLGPTDPALKNRPGGLPVVGRKPAHGTSHPPPRGCWKEARLLVLADTKDKECARAGLALSSHAPNH